MTDFGIGPFVAEGELPQLAKVIAKGKAWMIE
jgi:hypothetical protein